MADWGITSLVLDEQSERHEVLLCSCTWFEDTWIYSRLQVYEETRVQGYKDTRIQEYKGMRIQGYENTRAQGHQETRIQVYKNTRT